MARVRKVGDYAETLESRADNPREGPFGRFALCRDDQGSPFGLHQPPEAEGEGTQGSTVRRPTMDHVTLRARNLPASRRFYEAALAPLSLGLEFEHEGLLDFGSGEGGRLILQTRPDVALVDAQMPKMDGVELIRRLSEEHPRVAAIVLATFDDDEYVFGA
jgi:CheY-like chemotaxis protein